jgi:hypothetical protein
MKTVPSGSVDCLMKGALAVGGGEGAGYVGIELSTVLERVGSPVRSDSDCVVVVSAGRVFESADVEVELEILGRDVVVCCVCWPVDVVLCALSVAVAVVVFASSVVVPLTAEKEESARNVESRSERFNDSRVFAMVSVVSRCAMLKNIRAVLLHEKRNRTTVS